MIADKIKEIVAQRKVTINKDREYFNSLWNKIKPPQRKFLSTAIKETTGISIISEIKPASPTLGDIKKNVNIKE